jgi:hypothetical protein
VARTARWSKTVKARAAAIAGVAASLPFRFRTALRAAGNGALHLLRAGGAAITSGRALQWAGVPAALGCFYVALLHASPTGAHDIAGRYIVLRGSELPEFIPAVVGWPVVYVWTIGNAAHDGGARGIGALTWAGAGLLLVAICYWLNWALQTPKNLPAIWAVRLWGVSLGLSAFDLYRVLALPQAWDSAQVFAGLSRGDVLRALEIGAAVYLVSLGMVVSNNRVRPDLFGPWSKIATTVRRGLIYRATIGAIVLPLVIEFVQPMIARIGHPKDNVDLTAALIEGAVVLLILWGMFLGGMWLHVQTVMALIGQFIKMQSPIAEPINPFPRERQ